MTEAKAPKRGCLARLFRFFLKLCWWTFILLLIVALSGAVAGLVVINDYAKDLPDVAELSQKRDDISETTRIYSSDGQLIATLFKENRTWTPLANISENMRNAILAIEDSRFYEHNGVDPIGVVRAGLDLVRSSGAIHQGASTITMQLARNFFFNDEQSFHRKIREALLAIQIEKHYTKDEILELYLNKVYFGSGAYGVQAAASVYFDTKADKLTIPQAAVIAGLPASPSYYSPLVDERAAKMRSIDVLGRMLQLEMITYDQYKESLEQIKKGLKYANKGRTDFQVLKVPYFTTYVLKDLYSRYDEDYLYRSGLKIYTTVDLKLQEEAERIIKENVANYVDWYNATNAAAVVIENKTGYIRAMVGGRGWTKENQFNRAWQARRQPGSSFKVLVYATAVESGYSPDTVVSDNAITYKLDDGETWSPKNSDGKFLGNITMRTALQYSRNVVAVRLLTMVGAERVIEYAYRLGIKERLEPNLSLALGSCSVSPLEMASVFTVFPNGGIKIQPSGIKIIYDNEGRVIEDNMYPRQEEVLSESTAYTMCSMLRNAVENGTGGGAIIPGRPVGGKTGTTDEHRDAWFVGFTQQYTAAVWVGNDNYSRMWHVFGGDVAAPIWRSIMTVACKGLPCKEFGTTKNGQVSVIMCSQSKKRANAKCPSTYKEYYLPYNVPTTFCPIHGRGLAEGQMVEGKTDKKDKKDDKKEEKKEETSAPVDEPTGVPIELEPPPEPSIETEPLPDGLPIDIPAEPEPEAPPEAPPEPVEPEPVDVPLPETVPIDDLPDGV
ncbi:MAG: PBP1A family penicillin-binding protein [bacterium]|nr:PBP1A family penicillin-binding protein [bacterium]